MTIDLRERPASSHVATPPVLSARARTPRQHVVIALVALSAMGAALMSSASPAGIELADALYRACFAGTVVWFTARARRWTWPVLAGIAALSTATLFWQLVSVLALGASYSSLRNNRRDRVAGALVAAFSVPALLNQGSGPLWRLSAGHLEDPFAFSAIVTLIATAPAVRSGWMTLSRRRRRALRAQAKRVALAVGAILAVAAISSALAVPAMLSGLASTREAAQAAQDGDLETASSTFGEAAEDWSSANRYLAGPWMVPSRLVPVLGQHVRAAQVITGQASALSESAATVTTRVHPDELVSDGVFAIDEIDSVTPAVDALAATADRANNRIAAAKSPWLVSPLAVRIDRATELLGRASGLAGASAEALHVGSKLLGRDEPSRVLVMLSTPAEARGAGGFVGNWVLLEAVEGDISITAQYKSRELNALLEEADAVLEADEDYTSRYGRYDVERHVQDVTLSPDFPSVARVTSSLFRQATGIQTDAIVMIDPFVIEQMLAFTGPLALDSDTTLTGSNTSAELLLGQYVRYEDDEAAREEQLLGLTEQLLEALFDAPPDPLAFASELAPLAEQGRVALWLADDLDGSIAERLGLSSSFPAATGDLLAVVHQNAGQNKVDTFLEREVDIVTMLRPGSSEVRHDVTITLENTAPESGLPDAVLASNDQGLARGTNRMSLSIYSPHSLESVRVDGQPAAIEVDTEFDRSVYTMVLAIAPGDFSTIELELVGRIRDSERYEMTLGAQPLSAPDLYSWRLAVDDGSRITPPDGWTTHTDGVRWTAPMDRSETFAFTLDG